MSKVDVVPARSAALLKDAFPMSRPKILVTTARIGARRYRRDRDLPGAIPGLLSRSERQILPELVAAEAKCEDERRSKSAAYRPAKHVQILSALLAECARGSKKIDQVNESCSAALRVAM